MTNTSLLGLPLIDAAQSQKHVTHNAALNCLDALIYLSVTERNRAGETWIRDAWDAVDLDPHEPFRARDDRSDPAAPKRQHRGRRRPARA